MKMKSVINTVFGKLAFQWNQPTTKAGILTFAGMIGFAIKPEWVEPIFFIVGGLISLIFVATTERPDRTIHDTKEDK